MSAAGRIAPDDRENVRTAGALGRGLVVGALLCLTGAGLLLWWWQGDAVFGQYLLGALAWCF